MVGLSIIAMTACSQGGDLPRHDNRSNEREYTSLSDSWELLRQDTIIRSIRTAAYLNSNYGITGGPSETGKAHVTIDGGQTWNASDSSVECLFGLDVVDPQIAWQCSLGPVGRSIDGGQTWETVSDYGNYCKFLSFLDATTGWIAAPDRLGRTSDGGASWQAIDLPQDASEILAISLSTPMQGYVLDIIGQLFITQDGGESWQYSALPIGDAQISILETASAGLRFMDTRHGLVVLHVTGNSQSKIVAFHTSDGGMNWIKEDVIESPMFVSLYLSHDASYLTITNIMEPEILILKREDEIS